MDISICVPTRNRAELLRRCLEHLLTFTLFEFEVIVCDNASSDNTAAVVNEYKDRFPALRYYRHDHDIGFARNLDAAMHLACGDYIFPLSDDDILFEKTINLMKDVLDNDPTIVAISGEYSCGNKLINEPLIANNNQNVSRIMKGQHHMLFQEVAKWCDGFPLIRREIFQRTYSFDERGFGLLPLSARLLQFGDLCLVSEPVIMHNTTENSLGLRSHEPWFAEFCVSDIETAFAGIAEPLGSNILEEMRVQCLRIIYIRAATRCYLNKDYVLMWNFLRRAKAVGSEYNACLLRCERRIMPAVAVQKLAQMLSDMEIRSVAYENTPLIEAVKSRLQSDLPQIEWCSEGIGADVLLLESFRPTMDGDSQARKTIAFLDVLNMMRLTDNQILVSVAAGDIKVDYVDKSISELSNQPSKLYEDLTSSPTCYLNMGIEFLGPHRLEEASICFQHALTLKPDFAEAHYHLGLAYSLQGKLLESAASQRRALAINPNYAEAYDNLGYSYLSQGNLEQAITCYQQAVTLKPDYAPAHYNLGLSLSNQGKLDQALLSFQHALAIDPRMAEALCNIGNFYIDRGKLEEAVKLHQAALTIRPENAQGQYQLGLALSRLGKLDEAISCYNKALAIRPDFAEANSDLTYALSLQAGIDATKAGAVY